MLGDNLKHYRRLAGYSLTYMGKVASVTPQAYSYYESNRREPRLDTLKKISRALNVSIDILLDNAADNHEREFERCKDLLADAFTVEKENDDTVIVAFKDRHQAPCDFNMPLSLFIELVQKSERMKNSVLIANFREKFLLEYARSTFYTYMEMIDYTENPTYIPCEDDIPQE